MNISAKAESLFHWNELAQFSSNYLLVIQPIGHFIRWLTAPIEGFQQESKNRPFHSIQLCDKHQ